MPTSASPAPKRNCTSFNSVTACSTNAPSAIEPSRFCARSELGTSKTRSRCRNSVPVRAAGAESSQRHRARRRVRVLRAFRLGPQRRGLRFRRLWFPLRRRLPEPRVQRRGAQWSQLPEAAGRGTSSSGYGAAPWQQLRPSPRVRSGEVRCHYSGTGTKKPISFTGCTGCQGCVCRAEALPGEIVGAQIWPGHRAQGQTCGRRPDRGDQT